MEHGEAIVSFYRRFLHNAREEKSHLVAIVLSAASRGGSLPVVWWSL